MLIDYCRKEPSQYYDPCQQASQMSLGCLERNNYDKEACIEYFKAYKECRQEWVSIYFFVFFGEILLLTFIFSIDGPEKTRSPFWLQVVMTKIKKLFYSIL